MKSKIIPVIKIDCLDDTEPLLCALKGGGICSAEITFRTACAAQAISLGANKFSDMEIGAGTIINAEQCRQAIDSGARFIISPGLSESLYNVCSAKNVPYIPGCVTPSEIMRAIELNISTVKFFPSESFGGIKAVKALAAPFPQMRFIPTGGIGLDNIRDYLNYEKVVACGASFMCSEKLIYDKNWLEITKLTKEIMQCVQ